MISIKRPNTEMTRARPAVNANATTTYLSERPYNGTYSLAPDVIVSLEIRTFAISVVLAVKVVGRVAAHKVQQSFSNSSIQYCSA